MPLTGPSTASVAPTLIAPNRVAAPAITPTGEQADIMQAYDEGSDLVIEALAGTGKTTTLKLIAAMQPTRPGIYLAFNKSIVREAEGTMPGRVEVTTAHGLAYRAIGHQYGHRLPGHGAPRVPAQAMARKLKVKPALLDTGTLNPVVLTRMAQATVAQFIKSADDEVDRKHIPSRVLAYHSPTEVGEAVIPIAKRIWEDLASPTGQFYFTHDVYLKLWAMSNPVLPASYIMFDEAQDSDPVIAQIVGRQAAQKLYVGDRNQAIYGWRGAIDAMGKVRGARRLPLTLSRRFGPAIAEAANQWLEMLGSNLRVVGFDGINSTIGPLDQPRAILCRTNGTALGWVLAFHERGIKVALAPGDRSAGKDIEKFAWAARDLMAGNGTDHPDLVGFTTWNDLIKFVEEEEDTADLKRMVGIINRVGVSGVIDAIRALSLEQAAQVTVSTAHKAKGLQWPTVKIADDFVPPDAEADPEVQVDPADLMLNYVTVTRAQHVLDPGALGEPELWRL